MTETKIYFVPLSKTFFNIGFVSFEMKIILFLAKKRYKNFS